MSYAATVNELATAPRQAVSIDYPTGGTSALVRRETSLFEQLAERLVRGEADSPPIAGLLEKWSNAIGAFRSTANSRTVYDAGLQPTLPAWAFPAVLSLQHQQELPMNWDSLGGAPVSDRHAVIAWNFLRQVMADDLSLPDFVPLGDGGVQLEWDMRDAQLSFTTEEDGPPVVWLSSPDYEEEVSADELASTFAWWRSRASQQRASER